MSRLRHIDIQTKIILVLVAVIVPTFLITTVLQNKITKPMLEGEMKQIGMTTAESLATKIASNRWLSRSSYVARIEAEIQETVYLHPSIIRMDVFVRDGNTNVLRLVASNVVEEDPFAVAAPVPLEDKI